MRADRVNPTPVGFSVPSTKPRRSRESKYRKPSTSSATVTAFPKASRMSRSSAKHMSARSARMWNSKSPGVATAVCTGPRISANGRSCVGRRDCPSRSQAALPIATLQERRPCRSLNPTARTNPPISAITPRTRWIASGVLPIDKTRNTAARDSGAMMLCGSIGTRSEESTMRKASGVISRSALQARQQARCIPTLAAHLLYFSVELIDQSGHRQVRAVAPCFREADRKILAHPLDRKTEIEFAVVHGLVAVLHLPGLRRALGDGVDHRLDVETGLLGEMNALGKPFDEASDADLIDHFRQLPGACRSQKLAHPRIGSDHGLGAGIGVVLAAAHHRQHAVFGAGLAAGHRRVDEFEAGLGGGGIEFAGDFGGGGGVIDKGRALFDAGERAVGAERHRAQIVVIAD